MDLEKLKRRPWWRGRGKKLKRGRETNHKRLLKTENKLRVVGGTREGKVGVWHGGGHLLGEHWVLYGNEFGNKLYF